MAKISRVVVNLASPHSYVPKKGIPSFLPYFNFRRPEATNKQFRHGLESRRVRETALGDDGYGLLDDSVFLTACDVRPSIFLHIRWQIHATDRHNTNESMCRERICTAA